MLSLGGQIAHDLVGSGNALVNGAILASFAVISAALTGVARRISTRASLMLGAAAASLAQLALWLASSWHSLPALLLATSLGGCG